ncbi:Oxoglutarate 3-dioxygenase [Mycena indigotica]|uniref:Oxoglutarate 3-dioxygenase n=1 Tax=Mycena indigotica TaxID=2126181 RepID=A0A8H6SJL2_9AGAR|nr:Oxoglutarate 3-dioxygenase [Mycena indigotica]KAF7299035.1 Oxoglutarate 3-dioxygenase [Mycena indigotica]
MEDDSAAPSVASDLPLDTPTDDEESDQLASDMDDDDYYTRARGETCLPSSRIQNIVKAHGALGSLALSREAMFVLSVATEEFIGRLALQGSLNVTRQARHSFEYWDMATAVHDGAEFSFLMDTIPLPVTAQEAMELREERRKELIANDPALLESTNHLPLNGTTTSTVTKPKAKSKPNGKEKASKNANASAGGGRTKSSQSSSLRWDTAGGSNGQSASAPIASTSVSASSTRGSRGEAGWSRWAAEGTPFPVDPRLNGLLANANAHTAQTLAALNGLRSGDPAAVSSLLANPYQRTTLWTSTSASTTNSRGASDNTTPTSERPSSSLTTENPGRTIYSEPKPPPAALSVSSLLNLTTMTQTSNLPIINIAPYLRPANTPEELSARKAVSDALHGASLRFGFFYLDISAYVDASVPEELTSLARTFFHLPQETKDEISLTKQDNARGYQRLKQNVTNGKADNHEGLDMYRPVEHPDKTKPLWGENQFPDVPGFRKKYEDWIEKMKALGLIVMEAMAVGLGLTPDEWTELRAQVDDSFWVMRAIGYPPLPGDHDGFSCGAHKDYGCLTFLYADPTPSALQVFLQQPGTTNGASESQGLPAEQGDVEGVWINADPIPGCVVCNIGEMWEIWTNGLYKSTLHRVVHRSSNYRVSIPFFFEPNFDAMVKPLAAANRILGNSAPEAKPVCYGDFLMGKVGQIRQLKCRGPFSRF